MFLGTPPKGSPLTLRFHADSHTPTLVYMAIAGDRKENGPSGSHLDLCLKSPNK